VRILIVAPDVAGIDAIAEVRQLQAWHDIAILHGSVTVGDVYRALQEKQYDSVYFASHGGPQGIQLSNNAIMTAEDIAQACRQKEVRGVFLSACTTGRLASYAVRHGLTWAISSEVELSDDAAWKLAAAFYGQQRNGHAKDFVGAYLMADSGDGEYALHISPTWVQDVQKAAAIATSSPHGALPITRQDLYRWGLFFLLASIVLSTILARLAGG
jgi:hypothetical protein